MAPRKQSSSFNFPSPMDNDVLIGHGDVLRDFMAAWNGRDAHPVHPVWMLSGPRGIGKATLAYKIAKLVYGNVGDFFIIDMAHNIDKDGKPKPDAKNISVYTVRAMIEKMQMSSMSGEWRVILIDSVDELTTSAENAMLKLLEEPPAKTLFLLIVHQLANVLPTVRSRARVEKMHPLTIGELRELCNKFMPGTEITDETLRLTNGSFGRIANIKRTGGDAIYDDLIECLNNPHSHSTDVMAVSKKIAADPALYGILLDAVAAFGLADLYPSATHAIADITRVNLEPELAIFKIIMQIKKCL
ncbi:MAG: AAA family ATPase [Proteobacteria bacterium]|uniref:AAA family ATPase n=1 Tax=Candidatus Enterousia excrementavium TaxID=2840789 RepID=A0A940ICI6_9PROT|nr:AAA family ATPase [Candidatus Enterousia excrementavium]